MKNHQRGLAALPIIIIVVLILGLGGYFWFNSQNSATSDVAQKPSDNSFKTIPPSAPIPPVTNPDPTANWKTYTNTKYGFEFKYPGDWKLETGNGLPNAPIVTFSDNGKDWSMLVDQYAYYVEKMVGDRETQINSNKVVIRDDSYDTTPSVTIRQPLRIVGFLSKDKFASSNTPAMIALDMSMNFQDPARVKSLKSVLDQIASTFRFTP